MAYDRERHGIAAEDSTPPEAGDLRLLYSAAMRLTPDEVEFIARKIVKTLTAEHKIEADAPKDLIEGLTRAITEELMVEDRLNEEVRERLTEHTAEMQRMNITYTDMFKMLKKKMAKEKGIIL
jgi:uncharacterized protein